MSVFMIAEVEVTDPSWLPEYANTVHKIVGQYGGKYLSRSGNIAMLEGQARNCTLVALIQFPTAKHVNAFLNSPDYQPFARSRQAGSRSHVYTVDDTDLASTISYLPGA